MYRLHAAAHKKRAAQELAQKKFACCSQSTWTIWTHLRAKGIERICPRSVIFACVDGLVCCSAPSDSLAPRTSPSPKLACKKELGFLKRTVKYMLFMLKSYLKGIILTTNEIWTHIIGYDWL